MAHHPGIIVPEGCDSVLLHACCAPCSGAIVEWLVAHNVQPVVFYYNPNIYPLEEYEIRKNESKRHAARLGIEWIDGDGTEGDKALFTAHHKAWWNGLCSDLAQADILHPELEPERGKRCEACFYIRLLATAKKAQELGIQWFATTLASSRWKDIEQVNTAGKRAEQALSTDDGPRFWAQNWRKDGLQDRRNQLIKEYNFYNQTYCGCEFSLRN